MPSVFTLEAVFAKKGDALILHYGPWDEPKRILIDGGPRGVYKKFLKPRLEQIREEFELQDDESLPFRMAMVSHVDDDHIAGILDLVNETVKAKEKRQPLPYKIETLWHNSFDDILKNPEREIVSRMAATVASNDPLGLAVPKMSRESKAVVQSTRQGRDLRKAAKKLRVAVNKPFRGLLMSPAKRAVSLGHGLTFKVVGPNKGRVVAYQKQWDKDLKAILEKERDSARAQAFEDESPFNLASLCVLAKMKGKSILLTGDARGDFLLEDLEKAKILKKTKPLHVDILKMPHHGSVRNIEDVFFQRITADHYVFSGDGEHGNPDRETLDLLQAARGRKKYTVHFTFTQDAHRKDKNKKRRAALEKVNDWAKQAPANCTVVFRDGASDSLSILIDLLEPLYEAD
ncbi:MAG: hypothetical protein GY769_10270 [bacterium]|nr:hypothetical protein [bacterium]